MRLNGMISELEAELNHSMRGWAEPGSQFGGLASSPVYRGMRTMLAETEAQAAELRSGWMSTSAV